MREQSRTCFGCKNFYITHKKNTPYGCKLFGFVSKMSPYLVVKKSSGTECAYYSESNAINKTRGNNGGKRS